MSPAADARPDPVDIAVVIATRNRETRLAFALDALAEQTIDRSRFEVIVVRDGGSGASPADGPPGLALRELVNNGRRGSAATRNVGWRSTAASLVAFTDDDCRPCADWLAQLWAAWTAQGSPAGCLIQGRTEPDPDELPLLTGLARSRSITAPSPWYETCNLAYPRSLLESLGGFDERFQGWGGEDTDLGLRAKDEGAAEVYAEPAVVWHAVHSRTLLGALRESGRGAGMARLFSRHPQQRRQIFLRVFWKRAHATALLAGLGSLALIGGRRSGALALIPHALDGLDRAAPRNPRSLLAMLAHLPARLAVDLWELIATARGGLRDRTPLL